MFRYVRNIFIIVAPILFYNCKSTATVAEIDNLKRVVANKKFEITANAATPIGFANTRGLENLLPIGSTLANINLNTIQNYLKVKNDSVSINLPYYGEVQIATAYNTGSGIVFEGIPTKAKFNFNQNKNLYEIIFETKLQNETLGIFITLFATKRGSIVINSSNRTSISYVCIWKEI